MAKLDRGADLPRGRRGLLWVPPFIAGAAAATAAELAAGLLLYSSLGFLRALTVVLAVEMGAFGLGLWSVPRARAGTAEQARRAWLFCLVAYSAAAAFSAAWRMMGDMASSALARGAGLALLGALPMFAVAALLCALGSGGNSRGVGAYAALGASAGFIATGFLLVPALEPSSTLLVCVIALSGGALLHGWIHGPAGGGNDSENRPDEAAPPGVHGHGTELDGVGSLDEPAVPQPQREKTPPGDPLVEPSSAP